MVIPSAPFKNWDHLRLSALCATGCRYNGKLRNHMQKKHLDSQPSDVDANGKRNPNLWEHKMEKQDLELETHGEKDPHKGWTLSYGQPVCHVQSLDLHNLCPESLVQVHSWSNVAQLLGMPQSILQLTLWGVWFDPSLKAATTTMKENESLWITTCVVSLRLFCRSHILICRPQFIECGVNTPLKDKHSDLSLS